MTVETISEKLFRKFCAEAGISCLAVPRETNMKTPDYDLIFGKLKVVTEVKEIRRNKEEKESDRVLKLRGVGNMTSDVPGHRVRLKIQKSSSQIKARAQETHPSLLVLFDGYSHGLHIGPYHIRVAMYGLETFVFNIPDVDLPYVADRKLGSQQSMTPHANTSISAIATLHQLQTGEIKLNIYHNDYAAVPLSPMVLAPYPFKQFRLGEAKPGCFPQWECVA